MNKDGKWQRFVELDWYESFISFIFRFTAKTSEPLLAFSLIYSAANVLIKGSISTNDALLNNAFAFSTSIAIESSGASCLFMGYN